MDAAAREELADSWAGEFVDGLMPRWIARASDLRAGGFFDSLTPDGTPVADAPKTTLAQARVLFTLSHLALLTGRADFTAAAHRACEFLAKLRDPATGGHVRAVARSGQPTGRAEDGVTRSYDMSFVILALATYGRLTGDPAVAAQLRAAWEVVETRLTDHRTGLLIEDDGVADPAAADAPLRAQNPHMHMFEAALQAFEMTGERVWLDRATRLADLGLRHFLDDETGTIVEFRAPDLSAAPGQAGSLREIGHQFEWAWLIDRHARMTGVGERLPTAARMTEFALRHGFCADGPMQGAAFDAVDLADGRPAPTFLLWPQSEAGKAMIARHEAGDRAAADRARGLLALIARRYFAPGPLWCNQLDRHGRVLQPQALSRLLYHVVLFVTEGGRAGLWKMTGTTKHRGGDPCSTPRP